MPSCHPDGLKGLPLQPEEWHQGGEADVGEEAQAPEPMPTAWHLKDLELGAVEALESDHPVFCWLPNTPRRPAKACKEGYALNVKH